MTDTVLLRVSEDARNRAKAAAALDGVTLQHWVEEAIRLRWQDRQSNLEIPDWRDSDVRP